MRTDTVDSTPSDTAPDADAPLPLDAPRGDTGGPPPLSTLTGVPHAKIPESQTLTPSVGRILGVNDRRLPPPTKADRHRDLISRVDERIRKRASDILASAYMADRAEDPEALALMTPRQRKVVADANKNNRDAPVYLAMAAKAFDSFMRTEMNKVPVSPELHADIKVYVRNELTVNYRTMELEEREGNE